MPRPLSAGRDAFAWACSRWPSAGSCSSPDATPPRTRPGPRPALFLQNCGTCHTSPRPGRAPTSAPTSTHRSPRRGPTAWTPTPSRAWSSSRSPTRARSRRASRTTSDIYMPLELVTGQDAEDVAAYVASVAGIPGAKPPELPPDQLFTERCGLSRLPGGRHGRDHRSRPRRRPGRQGREIHRAADRRSELADRAGIRAGRDAAGLRDVADAPGHQGPGRLPDAERRRGGGGG